MTRRPDPLKADPTRTTDLRRRFTAEMRRRFAALRSDIWQVVAVEDAFGLGNRFADPMTGQGSSYGVSNTRWSFATTLDKVKAFLAWLKGRVEFHLLGTGQREVDDGFWTQYLRDAMLRGRGRTFDEASKMLGTGSLPFTEQSRTDFLRSAFNQPVPVQRAKQLASRVLTDINGVTEAMSTQMSRVLMDGLARGDHPRKVAAELTKAVDDIGIRRAETIARTEIIRAHAEGQLDAMKEFGVEEVQAAVEWSTAGDGRVCELCKPLEGTVLTLDEARGLLPRHPNCRCAWKPANVGEPTKGQHRSLGSVGRSLLRSISAESSRGSIKEKIRRSKWAGAGIRLSKNRPS